jgi:hypothetical protein
MNFPHQPCHLEFTDDVIDENGRVAVLVRAVVDSRYSHFHHLYEKPHISCARCGVLNV